VLAWLAATAAVCPDCGTSETDWIDGRGRHRPDPTFEATPIRCYGCAAISTAASKVPDGEKGVRVVLRPA
jgi:hypothetical protein